MAPAGTSAFLVGEARAMSTRLAAIQSFATTMPSVPAASVSGRVLGALENHVQGQKRFLGRRLASFLHWLDTLQGRNSSPEVQQRRFTVLRLQFNAILDSIDIFADALNQRSEHGTGVLLAGLDEICEDALVLPAPLFSSPPMLAYIDRGHGAAIRRARTRLPGGRENPVTIVRIPRERMVGTGIGSSLVHEVGHQGAALLGLVDTLRSDLERRARSSTRERPAWILWRRWISEIVADLWSVSKLGVAATQGLMAVVSLPQAFVFRINLDDPHPFPWIRVILSCGIGRVVYPDRQWDRLERIWRDFYPEHQLSTARRSLVSLLLETLPAFVGLLLEHRSQTLGSRSLGEVLRHSSRDPRRLRRAFGTWGGSRTQIEKFRPTYAFAVLGQARVDGRLAAGTEARVLTSLLSYWGKRRALRTDAARMEGDHLEKAA